MKKTSLLILMSLTLFCFVICMEIPPFNKGWEMIMGKLVYRLELGRAKTQAEKIVPHLKGYKTLLDLGSGTGNIALQIAREVDIKVSMVDIKAPFWYVSMWLYGRPCARSHSRKYKLDYEIYDGKKLRYRDNEFEVVLLAYVLHHAEDPERVLQEAIRVSKSRVIVLEDIHRNKLDRIINPIFDHLLNIELWGYGHKSLSEQEWENIFKRHGHKIVYSESWGGSITPNTIFVLEPKNNNV